MKKTLLFAVSIVVASILSLNAQKKVAYITFQKTMDATGTTVQNDPIIQMLSADPNLAVTVKVLTSVLATDVIADLSTYDVIIVQESFAGGAAMLMPAGALALKTIPKPFIYNKSYALKSGRALTTSSAAGGKEATACLSITPIAPTNDLFKACSTGTSGEIVLFNALMTDTSVPTGTATTLKALNYSTGNVVSGATTILANPTTLNTDGTPVAISFNDVPAGTSIDSEVTLARAIFLGMNFGAICGNTGKNITSDGLTVWRNAVYILAGLPVPSTPASLPTGVKNPTTTLGITQTSKIITVKTQDYLNLSVYSVSGQRISQVTGNTISIDNLNKGIYVLRMTNGNGLNQTYKFAK
jgi:hypothetical protein